MSVPNIQRQTSQYNTSAPRMPLNRTIINDRIPDPSIVAKLFLLCIEGNISAIKNYILTNGLTVNDMVDTNGESILHKILSNTNFSNQEKIELFKFLESNTLLKMSYDSTQTTPLHLAVKLQIPEIVKILINAGHDVNAADANGKTPIFYAISGKDEICPKKEKSLLKKSKFKYNKTDIAQLADELIKIINKDDKIIKLFQHINNTSKKLDEIYPKEINSVLAKNNKTLTDLFTSGASEQVIITKAYEIVTTARKEIIDIILKNKLQSTTKNIPFNPNTVNGWGPDNNPQNKTFLFDEQNFKHIFETELDKKIKKVVDSFKKRISELETEFSELKANYVSKTNTILHEFQYEYIFLERLSHIPIHAQNVRLPPNTFDFVRFIPGPQPMQLIEYDNTQAQDIDLSLPAVPPQFTFTKPNFTSRATLPSNSSRVDLRILNSITSDVAILAAINVAGNPIIDMQNGKYYTYKLSKILDTILDFINNRINVAINNLILQLNQNFTIINLETLLQDICNIQILLLNISLYLPVLSSAIEEVVDKNNVFMNKLTEISNILRNDNATVTIGGRPIDISDFFYDITSQIKLLITNDFRIQNVANRFTSLYSTIAELHNKFNAVIDLINEIGSTKYTFAYFNNFTNIDAFLNNNNTEVIDNIFNKPLEYFTKLPSNLEDFKKILSDDNTVNKKKLLELFAYQIHQKNYVNLYVNTVALPTIGLLANLANINTPPNTLIYGPNTHDATVLQSAQPNLQGNIGKVLQITQTKNDACLSVINNKLDEHISYIKLYIVRHLLNKIYDYLVNGGVPDDYQKLIELLTDMRNKLMNLVNLNANDYSAILIIVGKCIDDLIIYNIENMLASNVNSIISNTKTNSKLLLDFLAQLKTQDNTRSSNDFYEMINNIKNTTFITNDLKQVVRNLIDYYPTTDNPYLYSYAEDVFNTNKTTKQFVKKKAVALLDESQEQCYYVNYDIIDMLINNRANLNSKDKDGNNILFSALELNDAVVVEKIYKLIPVSNSRSKNIFGIRPIDKSRKMLEYYNTMFSGSIVENMINSTNTSLTNKTQITQHLRFTNEIFKMFNVLCQHYIFSVGKQYINGWTLDKQRLLQNSLGISDDYFPLINSIGELKHTSKGNYLFGVVHNDINEYSDLINKGKTIYKQILELQKELTDASTLQIRKNIITDSLTKLDKQIRDLSKPGIDVLDIVEHIFTLEDNIKSLKQDLLNPAITDADRTSKNQQLINSTNELESLNIGNKMASVSSLTNSLTPAITRTINDIKNRLPQLQTHASQDIVHMYDVIFEKIINTTNDISTTDYKTYMDVWMHELNTNALDKISIINNISNNFTALDVSLINQYFKTVVMNIAQDYTDLEQVYNGDNYVLTVIFNIMKHILSHTLSVNMLNILQQLLREDIKISRNNSDDFVNINNIDKEIIDIISTSQINNLKLADYIFTVMVEKLIKKITNIYEDETEKETIEDLSQIFNTINNLLMANTVYTINVKSQIIKELNDKIFPYFKEYVEIVIKTLKLYSDGFFKNLISYGNTIDIYLMIKSKPE